MTRRPSHRRTVSDAFTLNPERSQIQLKSARPDEVFLANWNPAAIFPAMTKPKPSQMCDHCGKSTELSARHRYCSDGCALWARVLRQGPDDCWPWTGSVNSMGYGQLRRNGRAVYAHRLAYSLEYGWVEGLSVCHSCDNPVCCNPRHHFLGTQADNMADMARKGRGGGTSPSGDDSPNRKLSSIEVKEIRELARSGTISQAQIAARFGVKQPTVNCIVRRRTWRHLP